VQYREGGGRTGSSARSSSVVSLARFEPARSSSVVEKQAGEEGWKLYNNARPAPARSSSEVEKQAGQDIWKLNMSAASPREVFERSREASG
jgi:hypothetical protein